MKILHIICDLKPGGAQRMVSEIVPLLREGGHDTEILVFDNEKTDLYKSLSDSNINILNLNFRNIRNPLNIIKLHSIIKNYDIIHSHTTVPQLFLALAASGLKNKIITTEHSTTNRRRKLKWYRPVDKFMYGCYDKIICISEAAGNNLKEWTKDKNTSKYVVINNGINLEKFNYADALSTVNNEGEKYITMVSRFVASKDQATLIRAIPLIKRDGLIFIFVGDGENKEEMEQLASKLNVKEKCRFLGNRNDVADIIAQSYIGVQSSHWEGFGLTAVEFMASGKPIIASDVEGLKDVVKDAGIIFKPGDEYSLAKKIENLLDNSCYYNLVAKKCRERAALFDIRNTVAAYLDLYKKL